MSLLRSLGGKPWLNLPFMCTIGAAALRGEKVNKWTLMICGYFSKLPTPEA